MASLGFKNLIIFTCIISCCYCIQFRGEKCVFEKSSEEGTCLPLIECSKALANLKKGISPQTCSFEGRIPIVCCSDADGYNRRIPGDISKEKCKEYNQYGIIKKEPPISLLSSLEINYIEQCSIKTFETVTLPIASIPKYQIFPHVVHIGYNKDTDVWIYTGTIISEKYVLTAAHTLNHKIHGIPTHVKLGLGVSEADDPVKIQIIKIIETIPHPEYTSTSYYNDIALLKMEESPKFSPYIRPACLYSRSEKGFNRAFTVGWAKNAKDKESRTKMYRLMMDSVKTPACNISYQNNSSVQNGIDDNKMMCASQFLLQRDHCGSDSGGPLQVYHDNNIVNASCMYDVIGVASFARDCETVNIPEVYTKVSAYIKWIEDVVWPA